MSPTSFLSDGRISVLVVLPDRRQQARLLTHLGHSNWQIHMVDSFTDALAILRSNAVGVVITQHTRCGDLGWRDILEASSNMTPAPRVIVTDHAVDERMWAEVLNLGAYDLLMQPFLPDELFRAVTFAWHSWHAERMRTNAPTGLRAAARVSAA